MSCGMISTVSVCFSIWSGIVEVLESLVGDACLLFDGVHEVGHLFTKSDASVYLVLRLSHSLSHSFLFVGVGNGDAISQPMPQCRHTLTGESLSFLSYSVFQYSEGCHKHEGLSFVDFDVHSSLIFQ